MEMFQYEADKAVALFVVIMTAIPIVILVVAKWLVGVRMIVRAVGLG